jgi:hypothetical protein
VLFAENFPLGISVHRRHLESWSCLKTLTEIWMWSFFRLFLAAMFTFFLFLWFYFSWKRHCQRLSSKKTMSL